MTKAIVIARRATGMRISSNSRNNKNTNDKNTEPRSHEEMRPQNHPEHWTCCPEALQIGSRPETGRGHGCRILAVASASVMFGQGLCRITAEDI